jgi:hypothetical protein
MLRILNEEISKKGKDFVIVNVLDAYAFEVGEKDVERVRKVRETITLGHVLDAFEKKHGHLYDLFGVSTESFRVFIKEINNDEICPIDKKVVFDDTKSAYIEKWQEFHPGENYEEYIKKKHQSWLNTMNHMIGMYSSALYDKHQFLFA